MLLSDVNVLMNAVTAGTKAAQLSMDSLPFSLSDTEGVVAISASAAEAAESVLKSSTGNCVDVQAVKRLLSDVVSSTGASFIKRQRVYANASAAAATSDASSISDPAVARLSPDEQCKLRTSRAAAAALAVAVASELGEPIRTRLLDAVHDQQCKRLKISVVDCSLPTSAGSSVNTAMGPPDKKAYVPRIPDALLEANSSNKLNEYKRFKDKCEAKVAHFMLIVSFMVWAQTSALVYCFMFDK